MWLIVGVLSVRTGYTTQQRLKSVEGHNKLLLLTTSYTQTQDGLSRAKDGFLSALDLMQNESCSFD